jgi:hypothetical protein
VRIPGLKAFENARQRGDGLLNHDIRPAEAVSTTTSRDFGL